MSWRDKVQAMREGVNCQNMPDPVPTKTTETLFVVSVSTPPPPISKNQGAANDPGGDIPDLAGWRVTLAPGIPPETVATFRAASRELDRVITDPTPDPDRWCWPHSDAINTGEIDTFTARLHQFTRRGLAQPEAETLADKLVIRDRDGDDRRLCLECLHLKSGAGRWGCNQWQRAGLGAPGVPADLVRQLHRCDSFNDLHQGGHDGKTTHA